VRPRTIRHDWDAGARLAQMTRGKLGRIAPPAAGPEYVRWRKRHGARRTQRTCAGASERAVVAAAAAYRRRRK
jgi:hypothetical protein